MRTIKLFLLLSIFLNKNVHSQEYTAFIQAAVSGTGSDVVEALEDGPIIDFMIPVGSNGMTALMLAAQSNDLQKVQVLLENNAQVDIQNSRGKTAIMVAARYGFNEVLELLVEDGIGVNLKDDSGFTALMFAARHGNDKLPEYDQVIETLLNAGANKDLRNNAGLTAANIAVSQRNNGRLRALLGASSEEAISEEPEVIEETTDNISSEEN